VTGRAPRPRTGQIVVIFAIALLAIALTVGLVVDGGMAFFQRRDGQNDADLAALAATQVVANVQMGEPTGASVVDTINTSLQRNGCRPAGGTPCSWTAHYVGSGGRDLGPVGAAVPGNVMGVRVDVTRQPRTFFLGLVGQNAWRVDTTATAMTAHPAIAPAGQLLPIALRRPNVPFVEGQVYDFTPDRIAPGGYAWVTWGKKSLSDSVCNPDNQSFALDGTFTAMRAAAGADEDSRLRTCMKAWVKSMSTVLIPIYDPASTPPRYRIIGVAAFAIRALDQPADGDIRAYFVGSYAFPTVPSGASAPPAKGDSLYYLGLVK
jgi:Putative Flp pilus-assembly TadE/G-like